MDVRVDDSDTTVNSIVVQIYCPCMCAAQDTTSINTQPVTVYRLWGQFCRA